MTFALDWGRIILLAAPISFVAAGWVLRDPVTGGVAPNLRIAA